MAPAVALNIVVILPVSLLGNTGEDSKQASISETEREFIGVSPNLAINFCRSAKLGLYLLRDERLGSDASIASTQRLGSDASIASTPTLFETSPSSSFRNADDEMSVCPSEDVPSEEATPTQPTQPTQPQLSQSARAWDRLYFARALRVSPPAGRRSPSSAEQ